MIMQDSQTRRIVEVLIHIIGWGIVFAFPFLLMNRSGFTVSLGRLFTSWQCGSGIIPDRVLPKLLFLHPPFLI